MRREAFRAGAALLLAMILSDCCSAASLRCRVTDCSTGAPLVGVRATLELVAGGVDESECAIAYSDPNGVFDVGLNEPPNVSVRLTLEKPRYATLVRDFAKAPVKEQTFCLASDVP